MNPVQTLLTGIAPEHAPALVAALLTFGWLLTSRWLSAAPTHLDRWAAALLAISAAVHMALPLGHHHGGPLLGVAFLVSGTAYAWLSSRARTGRRWRLPAVVLVTATLVAYLAAVANGEDPDQVGIATALVELTILGFALVPLPAAPTAPAVAPRPRRLGRFAGSTTFMVATLVVGAILWAAAFAGHQNPDTGGTSPGTATAAASEDGHHHGHTSRAQAGVLVRPGLASHHATPAQQQAAAELVTQTKAGVASYASIHAALAAGYRLSFQRQGTDVHLEHPHYKSDGRTLDPSRPEMLVYAIQGDRATLLGAVYVMETAGRPGPEPGGPITRWHAHNLCVSLVPIGFGIVSPYGNCPAFSLATGSPEMMHVWTVDNPNGPFADGLDATWASTYNAQHGQPFNIR